MNNVFETDDGRATSVSAVEPGMPEALQPSLPESSWEQFLKRVARSADSHDGHHHTRRRGDDHEHPDTPHNRRRGDDHRHHDHHSHGADSGSLQQLPRNISAYPHQLNQFMTDLAASSSFESIIAPELERLGYEPDELLDVSFLRPSLDSYKTHLHRDPTEQWTAAQIVAYLSTSRLTLMLKGQSDRAKELIRIIKNDENFVRTALSRFTWKQVSLAYDIVNEKARSLGIHDQKGRFGYAAIRTHPSSDHLIGAARRHSSRGELAITFEIKTHGTTRRFMIDLHSPQFIREIPINHSAFQLWMSGAGKEIAFKNPTQLPSNAIFSHHHFSDEKHSLRFGFGTHLAFPHIRDTTKSISDLISRDTLLEEAAHLVAGIFIPGWDAFNAMTHGNMGQALIFLGLELVPFVGKAGKIFVKAAFVGAKVGAKLAKTGAFAQRIAPKVFEKGKLAYGVKDTVINWGSDLMPSEGRP